MRGLLRVYIGLVAVLLFLSGLAQCAYRPDYPVEEATPTSYMKCEGLILPLDMELAARLEVECDPYTTEVKL